LLPLPPSTFLVERCGAEVFRAGTERLKCETAVFMRSDRMAKMQDRKTNKKGLVGGRGRVM